MRQTMILAIMSPTNALLTTLCLASAALLLAPSASSSARAAEDSKAAPAHQPEIVAHRGESYDAPENTMASFNLAWERGDSTVETDVHLTKDGKLIISHDPHTLR